MAMRRPSGDGMVRKQKHGRREGHIVVGHKENSDPIFRYIHAYMPKELTAKLRQNITAYQGVDLTEKCRMRLSERLEQMASVPSAGWLRIYLARSATATSPLHGWIQSCSACSVTLKLSMRSEASALFSFLRS